MNSNFQFLASEFSEFFDRATKAEQYVVTDSRGALFYARAAMELGIHWMFTNNEQLEYPYDTSLNNLMLDGEFKAQFPHKMYKELHLIRKTGNLASHNKPVSKEDAYQIIELLFYFAKWFAKTYATNQDTVLPGVLNWEAIPEKADKAFSKKEIAALKQELDKGINDFQEKIQAKEKEKQALAKKNELYKKQLEALQAQLEANKLEANIQDEVQHPRNEAQTRKLLIDVTLREAGWDLLGINDKEYKVQYMPKSTNTSETGYVDYVLWDDDGTPLALIEAKKSMENVTKGENQAQLYADCLEKMHGRRPIMYYSNGYETYLWDDQFYKQSRLVHGFYTKAELQTAMFRRTHRKDIRTAPMDTQISGRSYQMRSIKSIAEHFAGNDKTKGKNYGKLIGTNRGALLVLATGTGKTRTSIAFSKLMLSCNWAKRILFLADRTSLVVQAKSNFVKHLPEHASVNLLEEKDNPDARIAFSTYQTMMGLIDRSRDEEARFYGVGHFDLIIVDEAHRSIYKKYQAIFEYFDALFLGLTATPINWIDRNTYQIFGLPDKSPTDAYTFEEAVANNHLTPYKSIDLPTKFMREGIKYSELSEEEKSEFEDEILDGEEALGSEIITSSELNKWLFNKDTAIKTLRYVLENGIKKRGGEELGKTIVFAKNQKHAQFLKDMFMELDKEQFGNDYVKIITHSEPKSQEFIRRFCDEDKEQLPQIAISVDMMDTGIDAPSCVNLVFYKPVKSYAKFWQMVGRGSRLRPNLFGVGEDKTHFLIFDLCQNFEFFNENPQGIQTSPQKSLTEQLYGLRLQLAQYLKSDQFKENKDLQTFKAELFDGLHRDIASLNLERFDVKMKLEIVHEFGNDNREIWNHLSKRDLKRIEQELAPLVKPQKGDTDLARYYDKLIYTLITKRLETPNAEEYINSFVIPINKVATTSKKLLKKTTVPAVKLKEALIKLPLEEDFWKNEGITHLEKLRKGVRELVKYIDPVDQRYVTTNFEDSILEDKIKEGGFFNEQEITYIASPFKNNIHRLERLVREHENHITISRIRKGETITTEELKALESILFKGGVDKEAIEKELGSQFSLVKFIVSLMGLSPEKVEAAFANFINDYQLNAVQIEFLDTIKNFLTTNGQIEPSKLYDVPFKDYHNMGIDGVFTTQQADKIFEIVEEFNEAN